MLFSSRSVVYEEDFRRTACTSLLQHVVETSRRTRDQAEGEEQKAKTVFLVNDHTMFIETKHCFSLELDNVEHQVVGPGMVDMALHVCQEFLTVLEHGDIDSTAETPQSVKEQHWVEFLQDYYMVVQ